MSETDRKTLEGGFRCAHSYAAPTITDMTARTREAHITIEFDGDHVIGELRDERGAISAFSGWLDLISALHSLSEPLAETGSVPAMHNSRINARSRR